MPDVREVDDDYLFAIDLDTGETTVPLSAFGALAQENESLRKELMQYQGRLQARLGIKGTFECKNAAGEVIKTIEMNGSIPLERLGMSVEEAQTLVDNQSKDTHGKHRE